MSSLSFAGPALFTLTLWAGTAAATPEPPVLISPEAGALVGAEVQLEISVEDPSGGALDLGIFIRPALDELQPFRLVVLPDTQFYTEAATIGSSGDVFGMQVDWILDHDHEHELGFVSHVGDVVQDWDDEGQWEVADRALSELDGVVPWAVAWGNHDHPPNATDPGWSDMLLDERFPASRFETDPWWGGSTPDGTSWNSWQELSMGGLPVLMLHLMFEPEQDVLAWAAGIVEAYPEHFVVVVTHSFLDADGAWASQQSFSSVDLWDALVAPYPQVRLVISGHFPGEAHRSDTVDGQPVHQLLTCFHGHANLGDGFLRVLDLDPAAGTLRASTYSPWLDVWDQDEDSAFELPLPTLPLAWWAERQGVASGETVVETWSPATTGQWEWWVEATDAAGETVRSEVRRFEVDADAPVVDGVVLSEIGADSVVIAWTTDEPADSRVELGEDASYGQVKLDEAASTEHRVAVGGLEPGARYHFRVGSQDLVGNLAFSDDASFELAAPGDSGLPLDSAEPEDTGPTTAPEGCGCTARPPTRGAWMWALLLGSGVAVMVCRRRSGMMRG